MIVFQNVNVKYLLADQFHLIINLKPIYLCRVLKISWKDKNFMANHNELGKFGEEIAKKFLEEKGHIILESNWTWANLELDLISMEQSILVFTEVKTRQNASFAYPESAVGKKKEKQIYEAAAEYMDRIGHEKEIRFDIIAITIEPKINIEHFPDAFFPTW